jgi:hypothetical protein
MADGVEVNQFRATDSTPTDLLSQSVRYRSPLFQRSYVWKSKGKGSQLEAFWGDIQAVLDEETPGDQRFLGALTIHFKKPSQVQSPGVFWIIDGQQRLLTVYMSLLAIAKAARDAGKVDFSQYLIENYLTISSEAGRDARIIPTSADIPSFLHINELAAVNLSGYPFEPTEARTKLKLAFEYLLERVVAYCIGSNPTAFDEAKGRALADAILNRLDFVVIYLGANHDPQLVFDRLNNAGIKLSLAQLIKNVVFEPMQLASTPLREVDSIEHAHWAPFYRRLSDSDSLFEGFVFPYVMTQAPNATKSSAVRRIEELWRAKEKDEGANGASAVEQRLEDMSNFVPGYMAVQAGETSHYSREMKHRLDRFHRFDVPSVALPYILKAIRAVELDPAQEQNFCQCMDVVESFLVRRAVLGLEPTGLHAVFKRLWNAAGLMPDSVRQEVQTATIQFPDDDLFQQQLEYGDLYNRKKHKYLLYEYELSLAASVPSWSEKLESDHLVPRNLPKEGWTGVSAEEHKAILNTWGNLALMTAPENKIKTNRTWSETRERFGDGSFFLFPGARQVIDRHPDSYTTDNVRARSRQLSMWSLERWPK